MHVHGWSWVILPVALASFSVVPARADESAAGGEKTAATSTETRPPPTRVESARVLFEEGRRLASVGDYAAACPQFEASRKLDPGVGTDFNLADCWEQIGRLASAYSLFLEVAQALQESGEAEREAVARQRAATLVSKVPRLVIDVRAPGTGLHVTQNGVEVESEVWGAPMPTDAGTQHIVARAPGKEAWQVTVSVPSSPVTVSVVVPPLEVSEGAALPRKAPASDAERQPDIAAKRQPLRGRSAAEERHRRPPVAGWSLAATGIAGVAVGSIFLARYGAANRDAKEICPSSVDCTASEIDEHASLVDRARTARAVAYVAYAAGGVALASATVLFVTRGGEKATATPRRTVPFASFDDGVQVGLRGRF